MCYPNIILNEIIVINKGTQIILAYQKQPEEVQWRKQIDDKSMRRGPCGHTPAFNTRWAHAQLHMYRYIPKPRPNYVKKWRLELKLLARKFWCCGMRTM